jgi:pilus assembly protein CpaE
MPALPQIPDAPGDGVFSIALIGPDERRRREVLDALVGSQLAGSHGGLDSQGAKRQGAHASLAIREFSSYPPSLDGIAKTLELDYDLIVIELDSDPEYALNVVKSICALGVATVMVYSARADLELAIRSMRAGAREFLNLPLSSSDMAEALARVLVHRPPPRRAEKTVHRLFVFLGSKGGCGVTTLASNFAVSLAQASSQASNQASSQVSSQVSGPASGQSTLLIDLGLPLGDVAINLGMVPKYTTANALQDSNRLDASFFSSLLSKHSSGLYVLAAPGEFTKTQPPLSSIDKLLSVARQNFDYVVVDAGSRVDLRGSALFEDSAIIYLITQVGVSELRNANRMISHFFSHRIHTLQIVLNRYAPHALGFDEEHITKALTRPAQWRIPDDYATARRTQNTATPLALEDSPISRAIRQMARAACGLSENPEKKKRFSLFG